MKLIMTCLAVLFLGTAVWLGYKEIRAFFLPEPFVVELPDFHGRTLPAEDVKVGTFSINVEFSSTGAWGNDGVLTYRLADDDIHSRIVLNAWRPDPQTPGAFQHAFKVVQAPASWSVFHNIDLAKREGNKLTVVPAVSFSTIVGCTLIMVMSIVLFFCFWSLRKED